MKGDVRTVMGGFGTPQKFTAAVEKRNGVARIALAGDLDLASASDLSANTAEVLRDHVEGLVVDLAKLEFIDSSGLKVLLKTSVDASKVSKRFGIVGENPQIRRLFAITRTEKILDDPDGPKLMAQFAGTKRTKRKYQSWE